MFEYKTISLRYELEQAEHYNDRMCERHGYVGFTPADPERDMLAKEGADGWELCAVNGPKYYFKRKLGS